MRFSWDEDKNRRNLAKHGVSFELASLVFGDPLVTTLPDPHDGEERWKTIGLAKGVMIILVIHTIEAWSEEELVRIISARKATPYERKMYEESH